MADGKERRGGGRKKGGRGKGEEERGRGNLSEDRLGVCREAWLRKGEEKKTSPPPPPPGLPAMRICLAVFFEEKKENSVNRLHINI